MIVDVNVYLDRWPTRRLPGDEPKQLAERLRRHRVDSAWCGSFDGLLHKDVAGVNQRLAESCRASAGLFVPFGSVNPTLPDWEEDLRRCHEVHKMPGIRAHPNYHGYRLDDPRFGHLLAEAAKRSMLVQLAVRMEDDRTQHPLLKVPDVDVAPLAETLAKIKGVRLVILNGLRTIQPAKAQRLVASGNVSFDISMLEGIGGVGNFIPQVGIERVLFGSYAPFFVWEAAAFKLKEAALAEDRLEAVEQGNARRIMAGG